MALSRKCCVPYLHPHWSLVILVLALAFVSVWNYVDFGQIIMLSVTVIQWIEYVGLAVDFHTNAHVKVSLHSPFPPLMPTRCVPDIMFELHLTQSQPFSLGLQGDEV